jgi:hypothetical protein
MPRRNKGGEDALQVQVAFTVHAPKGTKIHPRIFQQAIDKMVNGEELPKVIEVRGIFWRNPNRTGSLSHWRYHAGADLKALKRYGGVGVESSPRGTLQDAIDTLSGKLLAGDFEVSQVG